MITFLTLGQSGGVQLAPYLLSVAQGRYGPDVEVINAAVGGTSLTEWQKGGALYSNMMALIAGKIIACAFHCYGEAETNNEEKANLLRIRGAQIITDMRADIDPLLPFVLPTLGVRPSMAQNYAWWNLAWARHISFDADGGTQIVRVKTVDTTDLPYDPNSLPHRLPAGYTAIATRGLNKYENMVGL